MQHSLLVFFDGPKVIFPFRVENKKKTQYAKQVLEGKNDQKGFERKQFDFFRYFGSMPYRYIVLTMIGISNSNKTCYQNGCQSRTNACI